VAGNGDTAATCSGSRNGISEGTLENDKEFLLDTVVMKKYKSPDLLA
jgi:hypothetical protein